MATKDREDSIWYPSLKIFPSEKIWRVEIGTRSFKKRYMYKVLLNINYTLVFFAVFFVVLKVLYSFSCGPLPDEAYYWLWSKNIGLSYYDHPPLGYLDTVLNQFYSP